MPLAFATLFGLLAAGETLSRSAGLPIPGAVLGFLALIVWLAFRRGAGASAAMPNALDQAASMLVSRLPIFLVPPSVGIGAHLWSLGSDWPVLALAVLLGSLTTLAVTGLVTAAALRAQDHVERAGERGGALGSTEIASERVRGPR